MLIQTIDASLKMTFFYRQQSDLESAHHNDNFLYFLFYLQMEIFSELNGGGYFIISNVRYGSIGSNFGSYSSTNKPITYRSTYSDGRVSYTSHGLGSIGWGL